MVCNRFFCFYDTFGVMIESSALRAVTASSQADYLSCCVWRSSPTLAFNREPKAHG